MKKENENGYEYTERLFNKINKNPKHTLPLREAVDYIKFYGLINLFNAHGKKLIVGRIAIERLDKALRREGYYVVRQKMDADMRGSDNNG